MECRRAVALAILLVLAATACGKEPTKPASSPTPSGPRAQCAREPGPDYDGAVIADRKFRKEDLVCATFREAKLRRVSFSEAELALADFTQAELEDVTFTRSSLAGVVFEHSRLRQVAFDTSNLRAASFLDATLKQVTFRKTTCPDGKDSDELGGTCSGGHM